MSRKYLCPNCKSLLTKDFEKINSEDWYCENCQIAFYDSQVLIFS